MLYNQNPLATLQMFYINYSKRCEIHHSMWNPPQYVKFTTICEFTTIYKICQWENYLVIPSLVGNSLQIYDFCGFVRPVISPDAKLAQFWLFSLIFKTEPPCGNVTHTFLTLCIWIICHLYFIFFLNYILCYKTIVFCGINKYKCWCTNQRF